MIMQDCKVQDGKKMFGDKNFRCFWWFPYDHEILFPEIYLIKQF